MSAQDNLNPEQFDADFYPEGRKTYKHDPADGTFYFHASDAKFGRGRMIEPGHEAMNSPGPQEHVYFGRTPEDVADWGKHVYAVNPQGDFEDDPWTPGALRSKSPLRVRSRYT